MVEQSAGAAGAPTGEKPSRHPLVRMFAHAARIVAGSVLILLGVAGLVFPIMPGWVFIVPGILLLLPGTRLSRWIRARAHKLRQRARQYRQEHHAKGGGNEHGSTAD